MSSKNFFGNIPIYIINLEDSYNRKEHILNEFKDFEENIEFISAVDGRDSNYFYDNYTVDYNSKLNLTTCLIAVICSHAKAIHKAYQLGLNKVCIFEDDVHLDLIKNIDFNLDDICNLNNDYEAIQLFYTENIKINFDDYIKNGLKLIKRDINYSGSAYIINRIGMEKFLNSVINTNGENFFKIIPSIIDPEDIIFNHINTYIINHPIVFYYFNSMTFYNYTTDNLNDKENCQLIHLRTKNLLLELYTKIIPNT